MNMDNIYLISDIPGYSPQISRLISMMNYARYTTIEEVKDLSIDHLDFFAGYREQLDWSIAAALCGGRICLSGGDV